MTLRHKTRFNISGQGFKKDPIHYQCYDICFYLPRSRNEFYVVVKKNVCGIDGGR